MFEEIKKLFIEQYHIDAQKITMDARFVEDLNADSMDIMEIIMDIENRFGIHISDEDAKTLKTVGDLIAYLEANKK